MMRDDGNVRRRLDELTMMVGSDDHRVIALFAGENDEAVSRFVLALLRDPSLSIDVAIRALWFVPLFPDAELTAEVTRLIGERPDLARLGAASLRGLAERASAPVVEKMLLNQTLPVESRKGALGILTARADLRSSAVVAQLLREGNTPPELLAEAARALALIQMRSGEMNATDELRRLLRHPAPEVRIAAITSLGNIRAAGAISEIAALATDASQTLSGEWVDAEAARVLRLLKGDDGGELALGLRASYSGDAGDWHILRELCQRFREQGNVNLVRRFESAQFMASSAIRALSFNCLGTR
jgi:hypothetical protein